MPTNSDGFPRRRSIRLKDYDYATAGAYFVTVCAQDRLCLFGTIVSGEMTLSEAGTMVAREWESLPTRSPFVELDAFVLMPNHLHGVFLLNCTDENALRAQSSGEHKVRPCETNDESMTRREDRPRGTAAGSAGRVMQGFKSATTLAYICGVSSHGWTRFQGRLWQRNYHEHVVRSEKDLAGIRDYIAANVARWSEDEYNPETNP